MGSNLVRAAQRVLVTGASGFVGAGILDRLINAGCSVRVLALPETVEQLVHRDKIEVVEGNLTDASLLREATQDIDVVQHFGAALPSNRKHEITVVNVGGTESLLRAAVENKVRRFVFASSMAAYNPVFLRTRWPITEDFPLLTPGRTGRSYYPSSKVLGEGLVRRYHREHGLEFVILRFPIVYGLRAPLVENLITSMLARPLLVSSRACAGPGSMQWIHVDDLSTAVEMAGRLPAAANETFNIAGNALFSMRDMLTPVAEQAGFDIPPVRDLGPFFRSLGDRRAAGPSLKYSIARAEKLMGFAPQVAQRECFQAIAADMDRRELLPDHLPSSPALKGGSIFKAFLSFVSARQPRPGYSDVTPRRAPSEPPKLLSE